MPYGTLLCVSDKPYTVKLNRLGQANRFYEGAISEHLQIGIRAIYYAQKVIACTSRKLRTFNGFSTFR